MPTIKNLACQKHRLMLKIHVGVTPDLMFDLREEQGVPVLEIRRKLIARAAIMHSFWDNLKHLHETESHTLIQTLNIVGLVLDRLTGASAPENISAEVKAEEVINSVSELDLETLHRLLSAIGKELTARSELTKTGVTIG